MPRDDAASARTDYSVTPIWGQMLDLAVGAESWQSLLATLQSELSARVCSVCQYDYDTNVGRVLAHTGLRAERVKEYESTYAAKNVWLLSEERYRTVGALVTDAGVSTKELIASEFFRDWLAPQKLFHRVCVVLSRKGGRLWYLSALRARAKGPFDDNERGLLDSLAPHLCSIFSVQSQLGSVRRERDVYREALNQLSFGIVITDEADQPIYLNRSAEALLDRRSAGPSFDQFRAIDRRIGKLVNSAGAGRPSERRKALGLEFSRHVGHQISVAVKSLKLPERGALDDQGARSLVILSDPDRQAALDHQILCDLFGLTPSEARLAAHVVMGQTVDAAAESLGMSVNTARGYLKHIFSKTGTNRQADLVRLVFSTVGQIRTD